MGILDNIERGIERAVNSLFARTFRSGLQPVEILAALKKEVDANTQVISRERIIAPNQFELKLSEADFNKFTELTPELRGEIGAELKQYIKNQGYKTMGPISFTMNKSSHLSEGMLEVSSKNTDRNTVWTPVIRIAGRKHRLRVGETVIGRGTEADITVADTGTSRKHLVLAWNGKVLTARDLGSTNGSKLNGERFGSAILEDESVIQIGHTQLHISLEPEGNDLNNPLAKGHDRVRNRGPIQ